MTKQQEIQVYLSKVPCATLDEIYANTSIWYYANEKKHLGEILSRMVKSGKIERVKKGIFRHVNASQFADSLRKQGEQSELFKPIDL